MNYPTTAIDIANYIAKEFNKYNKSKNIQEQISLTNRRLQLLLYFCEIEYMKQNGAPLFADDFNPWPHGPTIPMIASLFAQYFNGQICLYKDCIEPSDEIKSIVNQVLEATKNIDTQDLIKITNVSNGPWHQVYNETNNLHEQVISKESTHKYYLDRNLETILFQDTQVKNIPTSIFSSQEEADEFFTKVQTHRQAKDNEVEVTDSSNDELESNKKYVLTSIFANQEEADKLTAAIIEKRKNHETKSIKYTQEKTDAVYEYNVTYDPETLQEILEKLKEYRYISYGGGKIIGSVTKWPATKKNIQKRVAYNFSLSFSSKISNHTLLPETIVHHKENGHDFVSYKYYFEKLPDLYFYIDLIINDKAAIEYYGIFGYKIKGIPELNSREDNRRLAIQEILNYIDSPELVNHDTDTVIKVSNPDYDYKGLNELYKETLKCLNFKLIAVKKYLNNQEAISGLTLQRKRT